MRIPLRVVVPNGVVEAENLKPIGGAPPSLVQDMSDFGADWSGAKQLKISMSKPGDSCTLNIPGLEHRYNVSIFFSKGPSYGDAALMVGKRTRAEIKGYSAAIEPGGKIVIPDVQFQNGAASLRFEVMGKDPSSTGYDLGLDAFALEPIREYIPEWYVIGPFPNSVDADHHHLGLDTPYPPEREADLSKEYKGAAGTPVHWVLEKTPANGYVDLTKFKPSDYTVGYALTYVYAPKSLTVPLFIGTDDGGKVFLNDKEVLRHLVLRGAQPDQDTVALSLTKGWNKLVLKIENGIGGFGFYARIRDDGGSLLFDPLRKK
jgi:hypothetical protein